MALGSVNDFQDIDDLVLGRILHVLREYGVTRAKFGDVEFDISLQAEQDPMTFEKLDKLNKDSPVRPQSPFEVRFPGSTKD